MNYNQFHGRLVAAITKIWRLKILKTFKKLKPIFYPEVRLN